MLLRFIGKDYSMGLRGGMIYNVTLRADDKYIWVCIPDLKYEVRPFVFRRWACPYSSPQTFAENWSKI